MSTNADAIRRKVSGIVLKGLPLVREEDLTDDVELSSLGLDSMNAVTLVIEIEEGCGITFELNEVEYDHFRTVSVITALVLKKVEAARLESAHSRSL
jgi:acyl carrier protein